MAGFFDDGQQVEAQGAAIEEFDPRPMADSRWLIAAFKRPHGMDTHSFVTVQSVADAKDSDAVRVCHVRLFASTYCSILRIA